MPVSSLRAARSDLGATDAKIVFDWPIDLALTVASHGWARLEPWRWDPQAGRLSRVERIGGRSGTVTISQSGPSAVALAADGFGAEDEPAIAVRVRRWLSADWDPAPAIAALMPAFPDEAALIAGGGGRILRCSTFYEDFVKTVLTINTSWSSTCRMAAALVGEPGGGAFPMPAAVLDYGEARLRADAKLGFRAPVVIAATRRLIEDGAIDPDGGADETMLDYDYLAGLKGIGPYAAAHCRLLLHDFARIPVDSEVTAYCRDRHGQNPADFVAARADCGAYLALGYKMMRLREKLARPPPPQG